MDDEGSARFVPRIFDRSINDHQRSFLSRCPATSGKRARRSLVETGSLSITSLRRRREGPRGRSTSCRADGGVGGDADYENVFRENFRRPRRGSVHATDSRDPRQFPFYGRAIYHPTARHPTSNLTSGIAVSPPLDRITIRAQIHRCTHTHTYTYTLVTLRRPTRRDVISVDRREPFPVTLPWKYRTLARSVTD